MSYKISFMLTKEENDLFLTFCKQVGLDKQRVAKQAVAMVMESAYAQAAQLRAELEKEQQDAGKQGNSEGDMAGEAVGSQTSDSPVPSDT